MSVVELDSKNEFDPGTIIKLSPTEMFQVALGVLLGASTFPVDDGKYASTGVELAIVNYGLSVIKNVIVPFIPITEARFPLMATIDAYIFVASIIVNSLIHSHWLSWVQDMVSNGSGAIFDTFVPIYQGDEEPESKEVLKAICLVSGGGMAAGGVITIANVLLAHHDQRLIYTINPEGDSWQYN